MRRLERKILSGVVIAVLVYGGVALWADARAVIKSVTDVPYLVFMAAIGMTLVNYALRFAKWTVLLRRLKVILPHTLSLIVFVAGMSMSITPGKVGEVLKSLLIRDACGVPVARTAPVVFVERLTDLIALVIIAAAGIGAFEYGRLPLVVVTVILVLVVAVLQKPKLVHRAIGLTERHPRLAVLRPKIEELYDSTATMLNWRVLAGTTVLSVLSWSMEAGAFYLLVQALGGQSDLLLSSFIYSMSTILGAVSFLPGGLGVTEGSMIGVLKLFNVFDSVATATAVTYLIRFATLWFGVAVGFVALVVFRTKYPNNSSLDQ